VDERVQVAAEPLNGLGDYGADLVVVGDVAGQHPFGGCDVDAGRVGAEIPEHFRVAEPNAPEAPVTIAVRPVNAERDERLRRVSRGTVSPCLLASAVGVSIDGRDVKTLQ
jgi:hypothetical protein